MCDVIEACEYCKFIHPKGKSFTTIESYKLPRSLTEIHFFYRNMRYKFFIRVSPFSKMQKNVNNLFIMKMFSLKYVL